MSETKLVLTANKFVRRPKKTEAKEEKKEEVKVEEKKEEVKEEEKKEEVKEEVKAEEKKEAVVDGQKVNLNAAKFVRKNKKVTVMSANKVTTERPNAQNAVVLDKMPERSHSANAAVLREETKKTLTYSYKEIQELRSKAIHLSEKECTEFNKLAEEKNKPKAVPKNITLFTTTLSSEEFTKSRIVAIFNKLDDRHLFKSVQDVEVHLRTENDVNMFLDVMFKRSINEPRFAHTYVVFYCELRRYPKIRTKFLKDKDVLTMSLLNKAQEYFHKIPKKYEVNDNMTAMELSEIKTKEEIERLEYFGTIRLIAELYKQKAVIYKLVFICANELLDSKTNLSAEALTILIESVNADLKEECSRDDNKKKEYDDLIENTKALAHLETLEKRSQILVDLCMERISKQANESPIIPPSGQNNGYPERAESTPVKSLRDKYAPKPSRSFGRGGHGRRGEDSRKRPFENGPNMMKTPALPSPGISTGEYSEKSIQRFVKGESTIDELMEEIKKSNAYGGVVKSSVTLYQSAKEDELRKVEEIMKKVCVKENETAIVDALTELKESGESYESVASEVLAIVFTELIYNGAYTLAQLVSYINGYEDLISSRYSVTAPLYIVSKVIDNLWLRDVKDVTSTIKEMKDSFMDIEGPFGIAAGIFATLMKSYAGSNMSISSDKIEKVKNEFAFILPHIKEIAVDDDKVKFDKALDKLWLDADDNAETKAVKDEIINKLKESGLLE